MQLSGNQLDGLPPELAKLQNLKHLALDNNLFEELPRPILEMYALNRLSMTYNRLTALPSDLCWLTNLTHVDVQNNELLEVPPREVVEKGASTVIAYLRRINRAKWTH